MAIVPPIPEQSGSSIPQLIEIVEDGRKGFERAADGLAGDGYEDMAAEMREFAEQRARFSVQLREAIGSQGSGRDADGSAAGALHRGWLGLKDALTGKDAHAILAAAEKGEDHALRQYDIALEEDLQDEVRHVVRRQRTAAKNTHDRVRELRDQFA